MPSLSANLQTHLAYLRAPPPLGHGEREEAGEVGRTAGQRSRPKTGRTRTGIRDLASGPCREHAAAPRPRSTKAAGDHLSFDYDIAIVGGCGHVGLPLGLAFADAA